MEHSAFVQARLLWPRHPQIFDDWCCILTSAIYRYFKPGSIKSIQIRPWQVCKEWCFCFRAIFCCLQITVAPLQGKDATFCLTFFHRKGDKPTTSYKLLSNSYFKCPALHSISFMPYNLVFWKPENLFPALPSLPQKNPTRKPIHIAGTKDNCKASVCLKSVLFTWVWYNVSYTII